MKRFELIVLSLASALVLIPSASPGQGLLPLEPGWTWSYSLYGGGTATETVLDETRMVRGRPTRVVEYVEDGPQAQIIRRFYSVGPDGDVYLHGFQNLTHGTSNAYEPPLERLDQPLDVGCRWESVSTAYSDLDGDDVRFVVHYVHDCRARDTVATDAGDFEALGVGFLFEIVSGAATASERSVLVEEDLSWYADGVGMVMTGSGVLTSWSGPVPAETTTFSGLKKLFR